MKTRNYTLNTNGAYSTEEEIERLTNININDTTKIIGNFMLVVLSIFMILIGLLVGIILTFVFMFLIGTIFSLFNGLLTGNFSYSGNFGVIGNIFPLIIFGCIIYGQYIGRVFVKNLNVLSHLRETILSLYKTLTHTIGIVENIEQIDQLIQDTFYQTQTIRRLLLFRFFFTKSGKEKLQRLGILATHIAMKALQDLRSDLQIRLDEQLNTLEQAKGELKNIGGNSELEQVTELQQARLNKQIEQFEQLQKTLVRL